MSDTFARSTFNADVSAKRCLALRRRILEMSQTVSALHIAGAFSCLEMVEMIYFHFMRRAGKESPDTFLLSKGHGCLSQYTSLEMLGILQRSDIEGYCKPGGFLGTHPDYRVKAGIEASTGSLGHGLTMAIGMAYADKLDGKDRDVYVVMSDGELQEGSVWEGILLAPALKVNRLTAFVDCNDFQSLGRTSETYPNFYPVPEKLRAFGWECVEINGHSATEIHRAVTSREGTRPLMIVGRTTKGRGVSYMENVPIWHYRSPSPAEYQQAIEGLREVRG